MKKRHLLFAQLPKYVLLTCSMMTVGMTEAYSSPAPAQQSTQSAGRTVQVLSSMRTASPSSEPP